MSWSRRGTNAMSRVSSFRPFGISSVQLSGDEDLNPGDGSVNQTIRRAKAKTTMQLSTAAATYFALAGIWFFFAMPVSWRYLSFLPVCHCVVGSVIGSEMLLGPSLAKGSTLKVTPTGSTRRISTAQMSAVGSQSPPGPSPIRINRALTP